MNAMCSIARFLKNEEAATAVEYSVMLAMILLTAFAAISGFGGKTSNLWNSILSGLIGNGM
jgi:pilus assembly protein Flp/PilA